MAFWMGCGFGRLLRIGQRAAQKLAPMGGVFLYTFQDTLSLCIVIPLAFEPLSYQWCAAALLTNFESILHHFEPRLCEPSKATHIELGIRS